MRRASKVVVSDDSDSGSKRFSAAEFRNVMRSANFLGAVAFWRGLEKYHPDSVTALHAMNILRILAESRVKDCHGLAYSPQEAECLEYCGLKPVGVMPPGSAGQHVTRLSEKGL